jgi:hypothetical protein
MLILRHFFLAQKWRRFYLSFKISELVTQVTSETIECIEFNFPSVSMPCPHLLSITEVPNPTLPSNFERDFPHQTPYRDFLILCQIHRIRNPWIRYVPPGEIDPFNSSYGGSKPIVASVSLSVQYLREFTHSAVPKSYPRSHHDLLDNVLESQISDIILGTVLSAMRVNFETVNQTHRSDLAASRWSEFLRMTNQRQESSSETEELKTMLPPHQRWGIKRKCDVGIQCSSELMQEIEEYDFNVSDRENGPVKGLTERGLGNDLMSEDRENGSIQAVTERGLGNDLLSDGADDLILSDSERKRVSPADSKRSRHSRKHRSKKSEDRDFALSDHENPQLQTSTQEGLGNDLVSENHENGHLQTLTERGLGNDLLSDDAADLLSSDTDRKGVSHAPSKRSRHSRKHRSRKSDDRDLALSGHENPHLQRSTQEGLSNDLVSNSATNLLLNDTDGPMISHTDSQSPRHSRKHRSKKSDDHDAALSDHKSPYLQRSTQEGLGNDLVSNSAADLLLNDADGPMISHTDSKSPRHSR